MPVVGEAIIRVRVTSDRLAADIRSAVSKGLGDADRDIDAAGERSGQRLSNGISRGVRNNRETMAKDIGKEIELSATRFTAGADGVMHNSGDRLGRRFASGIGDGVNDRSFWNEMGGFLSGEFRNFASQDSVNNPGRLLGRNFSRAIGNGIGDGQPDIRNALERSVLRELTSGSNGALVRAGDVDGSLFMQHLARGITGARDDFNRDFRRVITGSFIDAEPDAESGFRRVFTQGMRGATPALGNEARLAITQGLQWGVRNDRGTRDSAVGDEFGRTGRVAGESFVGEMFSDRLRGRMRSGWGAWGHDAQPVIREAAAGERVGGDVARDVDRGLRRGVNNNRGGIGRLFSGFGSDLGKNFNLGIGASRMGAAAISGLILIGPSLLSGVGAILTALAGEIINFAAALGPGIAGALTVGAAGFATLFLNMTLLKLAFAGAGPQAKAFKAQMVDFKETLTSTFAPGVVSGFSDLITTLKNTLLPAIGDSLKATGQAMGDVARGIGETVTSAANMGRINGILATNTAFLGNFKVGVSGLVTAFLTLFNAAKPVVDFIGQGIATFGQWAATTLTAAEASGSLASFMDRMIANFRAFITVLGNFGSGIVNVFKAAAGPGASLFSSMSGISDKFKAWTENPANMDRMIKFFENARLISQQVFDLLGKIFTAGGDAFTNINPDKLQHFFDTLSKVGSSVAGVFAQIKAGAGANLGKVFDDISVVLDRAVATGSVEKFASAISTLLLALSDLVVTLTANPIGAQIAGLALGFALFSGIIMTALGPVTAFIGNLGIGSIIMSGLEAAAAALGASVGALVAVIAAVVGFFVLMWLNSENLRNSIGNLVSVVGGALIAAWTAVEPHLERVWTKLQNLASIIGDRLAPVIDFLAPIVARVFDFIGSVIGNIVDIIGGFIDIIAGILSGNWTQIWDGVKQVLSGAWDFIVTVFQGILSTISFAWDAITAVVYNAGQVLYGIINSIGSGIADLTRAAWQLFYDIIWSKVEAVGAVVEQTIQDFGNWIKAKWDEFLNFTSATWDLIKNAVIDRVEQFVSWVGGLLSTFKDICAQRFQEVLDKASEIWDALKNAVIDAAEGLYNGVVNKLKEFGTIVAQRFTEAKDGAVRVWNELKDAVVGAAIDIYNGVAGWIADAVKAVQTAWDTIQGIVDKINNAISGAAAAVANAPAAPSVGAGQATFGGTGLLAAPAQVLLQNMFAVAMARGGIINPTPGGTLAVIGEAGRRERVEPLDSSGLSMRDRAMIEAIVGATVGGSSDGRVINLHVGNELLTTIVDRQIGQRESSLAQRASGRRRS